MRATKSEESQGLLYSLYTVKGPRPDPIITSLNVDGQILEMEVDTGATLSIVSEEPWRRHWLGADPQHSTHVYRAVREDQGHRGRESRR